jgi:cation:H+ antiporter
MIFLWLSLVVVGCIWIMKSCDPFEEASSYLGRNLGPGIKGASINAIGSSMPELWTACLFLFYFTTTDGSSEFSAGIATTAGSAVFNAFIIPGLVIITALKMLPTLKGISISKTVIIRDGFFFLLAELALILLLKDGELKWWMGAILIGIYFMYAITLFVHNKISKTEVDDEDEEDFDGMTTSKAWLTLCLSTVLIGIGCFIMSYSVVEIAKIWEISTFFIAVIIAAAATSVPDTIISMKDAKKGNYDDAVSNAVGSNIFDICICLGVPLLVYTLVYEPVIKIDVGVTELRILLLGMTAVLLFIFLSLKKLGYKTAVVLLSLYALYAFYTLSRGKGVAWANEVGTVILGILN